MDLFARIRGQVLSELDALMAAGELPAGLDVSRVTALPPRDEGHGELATNAAMVLAKPAGRPSAEIAQMLVEALAAQPDVLEAEAARGGFVNLRLQPELWHEALRAALREGTAYGRSQIGGGVTALVEYVSANPTGPLHVGHARGAVYGDALASLLEFCGWDVTREYYINDAGAQVDTLARSAYLRYREALGETVELPEGSYPGGYLKKVGEALAKRHGDALRDLPESDWLEGVRDYSVALMMEEIRADLAALSVRMDRYASERELQESGRVEKLVEDLAKRDLVYQGTLERPKGAAAEDWIHREQLLFRSSKFGDDTDRPLQKADGSWSYFAPDMAYHGDKLARGFRVLIDVWGEDHGGYVRRMKAAVAAMGGEGVEFDVKLCRLVRLLRDGEPFSMSKRKGDIVLLRDFLDEVGSDVARFLLLTRKNDAALDLDVARAQEQSRDNPVFYVHYAHARACSVLRMAEEGDYGLKLADSALAAADFSLLGHEVERRLVRRLAAWPSTAAAAALAHEPHRISFFLQDVAADFHGLWTAGKGDALLRFLQPDDSEGNLARLALVRAAALVIASGLGILGIQPREEMR